MTALLVGTALAVASLCYVLYPLFRTGVATAPRLPAVRWRRENYAIDALRELEFDRETGKISDSEYESLKARFASEAPAEIRARGAPVCERCGPRTEADAEFCSSCGGVLFG